MEDEARGATSYPWSKNVEDEVREASTYPGSEDSDEGIVLVEMG
jgi:hypothetical protein